MEPEEPLKELKKGGIAPNRTEEVDLYKDEELPEATMSAHLKTLLRLNRLHDSQLDWMRNLSLLPLSGIPKIYFKEWLNLDNLNEVNRLIRYGLITEDTVLVRNNLFQLYSRWTGHAALADRYREMLLLRT